jgi:hypothetical protein
MITRKPLSVPPAKARAFVKDMRAFFAEENAIKRDESQRANTMLSGITKGRATRSCG